MRRTSPRPCSACWLLATLLLLAGPAGALVFETEIGTPLADLAAADDLTQPVALRFGFPYAGASYTTLFVGNNGAVGLGAEGEAANFPSGDEFASTTAPLIAPFWSDLDTRDMGSVSFNDFGDRAVVTWSQLGTFVNTRAPYTFQLQLLASGRIVFAYDGISSLVSANIDEDVHVGLSQGNLSPPLGEFDFSAAIPFTTATATILEVFDIDLEPFDLDGRNLVFTPRDGGFLVTPEPGSAALVSLGVLLLAARRRAG